MNPKGPDCVERSLPHIPVLSHMDPVNTLSSYFFKIHFDYYYAHI
jgi:hypothetical protein